MNISDLMEYRVDMEYKEGDWCLIDGKPHHLFRNINLNNDLIWTPFDKPPIGYVEFKEERDAR